MTRPIKDYKIIHHWLTNNYGQPRFCEACATEEAKKYEWAAINGLVTRVRENWLRLCVSCHRHYDGHGKKVWEKRRARGDKQWTNYKRGKDGRYVAA